MQYLRILLRGVLIVILLIDIVSRLLFRPLVFGYNLNWALGARRKWAIRTMKSLGIQLEVDGNPPSGNHIFVGNHRGYLDPIIVLRDVLAIPVAKSEVASWPLIGKGAKASGIMFVKRDSKISRADTLDAMKEVIKSGYPVLVYPEGTTHTQPTTIEFRQGAFKMAFREGFTVVPMALEFEDINDAWIGEETFFQHFVRCFGRPVTRIKIGYGQPIKVDELAPVVAKTRNWIDQKLLKFREEFEQNQFTPTQL
jgi:1-acyl-sn-glycerol-3-phosphate acyltransferase